MPFCNKCGNKLEPGDLFCGVCGSPAPLSDIADEEEPAKKQTSCSRVDQHEGESKKGRKKKEKKGSSAALLSEKLDLIESERPEKLAKEGKDVISATDERKISLIRTWPIPDDRDDLFELMVMASGNCIPSNRIGNDRIASEDALSDAWRSKFDQVYAQAERRFGRSEDFSQFRSLKSEVQSKTFLARISGWVLLLGLFLLMWLFIGLISCVTFRHI